VRRCYRIAVRLSVRHTLQCCIEMDEPADVATMGHCMGHVPLDLQQFNFFPITLEVHKVRQRLYCAVDSSNILIFILYSTTAAAVVQSRLHEPCSVYYLASFYARQKVLCSFVPPPSRQILATPLAELIINQSTPGGITYAIFFSHNIEVTEISVGPGQGRGTAFQGVHGRRSRIRYLSRKKSRILTNFPKLKKS